jgi:hypothetical protein
MPPQKHIHKARKNPKTEWVNNYFYCQTLNIKSKNYKEIEIENNETN